MNQNKPYKPIVWWLMSGCLLILLMVVIGGVTRLTNSGLSMTDWKLVTGTFPPVSETQWFNEFEKYQESPEFQKVNYHFSLEEFKSIFWWEYIHRLIGRVLGLVFVIPFLIFWFKRKIPSGMMSKLALIFCLGGFQGFLGWYMVKSGLVDRPHVSHFRLTAHLLTAFITCTIVFWVILGEWYKQKKETSAFSSFQIISLKLFMGMLILQIVYGAFVAGLRAGYIYNAFPKMGEYWIAEAVTAMKPWWQNWFENGASVQFIHRYLGISLLVGGVLLIISFWKKSIGTQKKGLMIFGVILCLQFLLGVFTLLWKVPISLGVLHQLGAFLLLMSSTYLLHRTTINR